MLSTRNTKIFIIDKYHQKGWDKQTSQIKESLELSIF